MTKPDRSALLEAFTAAWEAKGVAGRMGLMADDCAFRASVGPEPGVTFSGRDEVREGFERFLNGAAGPVPENETEAPMLSENFAGTRWTNRFPQPDGPPVVVRACDVFEFAGDRIAFKDTYRKV